MGGQCYGSVVVQHSWTTHPGHWDRAGSLPQHWDSGGTGSVLVQLVCPLWGPLDFSSFPLEAGYLPYSTPTTLAFVPPQVLLQFLPVNVLTLSRSLFDCPLYLFEFLPVPWSENPLLPVEKGSFMSLVTQGLLFG